MNILMALAQIEMTGAETYAVAISDELINRGHKVYIMSDNLSRKTKAEYYPMRFCLRNYPNRYRIIKKLTAFIREKDIDLIHAHARASSWVSFVASRLTGTPMLTTLHSRQAIHFSKKMFPAFGDLSIAICENVKTHTVNRLGIDPDKIVIVRNGIDTGAFAPSFAETNNHKPVVSIIGRLSGPKGEIAYRLMDEVFEYDKYLVKSIGGSDIPIKFGKFAKHVEFIGYVDDVTAFMAQSDAVVGAGRVAMEAILMGRPVVAVGEDTSLGFITPENVGQALANNFGDWNEDETKTHDLAPLRADIVKAIEKKRSDDEVIAKVKDEFDIKLIVDRLEKIYLGQIELKKKN